MLHYLFFSAFIFQTDNKISHVIELHHAVPHVCSYSFIVSNISIAL